MTIAAYQTLYESSVAFGMRKALQAEQGKSDMERKVSGANSCSTILHGARRRYLQSGWAEWVAIEKGPETGQSSQAPSKH